MYSYDELQCSNVPKRKLTINLWNFMSNKKDSRIDEVQNHLSRLEFIKSDCLFVRRTPFNILHTQY